MMQEELLTRLGKLACDCELGAARQNLPPIIRQVFVEWALKFRAEQERMLCI
jgi:hypothetical protein